MKHAKDESPTVLPSDSLVPLESVLCTEELNRRPSRAPDYQAENRALVALAQALADSPRTILQRLAQTILEVLRADSAGISLLTEDEKSFYWAAIAGMWQPHIGGGTPRDFGPCGDVLDRDAPLLFKQFERRYTYFQPVTPSTEECLLVPFYVGGKAVGTIWAIGHDGRRKFDAEDMRQLVSLGSFASSAYQVVAFFDALEQRDGALRQTCAELAQRVAELQNVNVEVQGSRSAALNLMEDAIQSRQAMEKLNAELRESERRFRQLADTMPQIVWAARPDGYIDYYNRRWYEYTCFAENYGQESWEPILHPDDVQRCVETYFGCVRAGQPYQIEYRFKDRFRGGYRWFMGRALPIKNEQGEIVRWFGTCTDIDEVKRAEEERARLLALEHQARQEADEANRMKDEFLATVSHELRTPLNAILGWANTLLRGKLDEQAATRALENIARNARAQNQLISDLLDVSRIISGKLRFEVSAVDLSSVIEAALETVRPAAEAKGVELRLKLDPTAGLVSGDETRLQQVVWNLLTNAIKYTPRGGHVETRLEREGTHAAIIVRDTGEGINADFLPYVFNRFQQADGTTTRKHGGLGLGLAIVRHLVEAHGGQVSAASEGAGQGATFTVTLPLMALRNVDFGLRNEEEVDEQSAILTGLRVLVVDDELDARELLRWALTQDGAEVRTVTSAAEALDILSQWQPEVLVSDIGMPGEDGYKLIRQVRALPADRGGQVPAVALTGYARLEDQRRALAAGYQIFVPKPVELDELASEIARLAGRTGKI
jgi:PAS domain S-box-containing protein